MPLLGEVKIRYVQEIQVFKRLVRARACYCKRCAKGPNYKSRL